jgi:hypothetical protein
LAIIALKDISMSSSGQSMYPNPLNW